MPVQEVMLKAVSGEIHWFRAADILGWSPRTLRRWRVRYEEHGYAGLVDRRWLRPSKRRIPAGEVERVLRRFVKQLLQAAKLVKKHRARGRHRRRREPRACLGEMLHLDGSVHEWFTLAPAARPCLIVVSDDATKRVFHAAFYPSESTWSVMTSLAAVLRTEGLPMALYTDRAHWAFHTPTAKGPVDKTQLTQVGRALARLGIEHIPSYSPQARGRSERLNRTLQDRLVNELRVAGIATLEAANRYLVEHFLPVHNATFACAPRDPASAFVPLGSVDLDPILCREDARVVARDNTVTIRGHVLQVAAQPGRRSCAGLRVYVREHLDGRFTITRGARHFGTFTAAGQPVRATRGSDARPRAPRLGGRRTARHRGQAAAVPGVSGQPRRASA